LLVVTLFVSRAVVYEEGDDADDYGAVRARVLSAVGGGGIRDGTALFVSDFTQVSVDRVMGGVSTRRRCGVAGAGCAVVCADPCERV
jgi:hypothetical protein